MVHVGSSVAIHWFRKGLRTTDNPALSSHIGATKNLVPIFILDPSFNVARIGNVRWRFLADSLRNLNENLQRCGSQLLVLRGKPSEILPALFTATKAQSISWEHDTEPYAKVRDDAVKTLAAKHNVAVSVHHSHTLFSTDVLAKLAKGNIPNTYKAFLNLVAKAGRPLPPVPTPGALPSLPVELLAEIERQLGTEVCGAAPLSEKMLRVLDDFMCQIDDSQVA